jgi:hypothetical protein
MSDMQDWRPPKEMMRLMSDVDAAIKAGDFEKARDLHRQLRDLMPDSFPEYPGEYYNLMHEQLNLEPQDWQGHKKIQSKLNEVWRSMGYTVTEAPAECQEIMDRMMQSQEPGNQTEMMKLSRDFSRCMAKHGFEEYNYPDEYWELQVEAMEAMEKMDMVTFHTLMAKVEQIKLDRGGPQNIINIIQ